mmetsp:Transcript_469/g.1409  ORF Transcript_469/g.1409 Transcript_469/m.1409 type:complete len:229 (-) Transcript_469:334-1020(-)
MPRVCEVLHRPHRTGPGPGGEPTRGRRGGLRRSGWDHQAVRRRHVRRYRDDQNSQREGWWYWHRHRRLDGARDARRLPRRGSVADRRGVGVHPLARGGGGFRFRLRRRWAGPSAVGGRCRCCFGCSCLLATQGCRRRSHLCVFHRHALPPPGQGRQASCVASDGVGVQRRAQLRHQLRWEGRGGAVGWVQSRWGRRGRRRRRTWLHWVASDVGSEWDSLCVEIRHFAL